MSNIATAVDALLTMTQLGLNMMDAASKITMLLQQAQSEGRDLTEDEMLLIQSEREGVLETWKHLAPKKEE